MTHVLPGLPGLPIPLWVQSCCSADGRLLSGDCRPATDRRSWLLLLCQDGVLRLRDGDETRILHAGDCLLRPHPDPRLALLPASEAWRGLAFVFTGMDDLVQGLIESSVALTLPSGCWAQRQLQQMVAGTRELGLASAMRLVAGVLANLIEHSLEEANDHPDSHLLQRCREHMADSIESDRGIAQIAQQLGVSQGHISRLFRKHMGVSPGRYLQELRMQRACTLLRNPKLDVTSIAERLGYGSAPAFSTAFKQSCGCSPSDYRNSRSIPLWEQDG